VFRRAKSLVGLDIGSSAVKAVELKQAGKGYKVTAFGSEPVPPDSIVDGAIIDAAAVADAIRRLFDGRHIKTKDVAASLSGNAVIVKKITLPVMTEAELAESIYWEAEQYIPFDIQDVNLDYQILDSADASGKGTMDVLLVAAKKEKIADYTGVIAQAGRSAVVVDVDAFALQNAYEVNYGIEPSAVVVLLNAGASATNINILNGDQSVFTRDISIGGNAYTEALQKELSLPFDLADQLKRGMPVDGVTFDVHGGEVCAGVGQAHGDGAGRVAEIPEDECSGRMGGCGDRLHVRQGAGAVGDVGEADERDVARSARGGDGGRCRPLDGIALEEPELEAARGGEPLEHVAVGGEVVPVGHDRERVRAGVERGGGKLVEVHRGRVGDGHLARPSAEDPLGEEVAGTKRQVDPVRPGGDEPASPFGGARGEGVGGLLRQAPERVAVHVDAARVVVEEALAEARERIGGVESLGTGALDHRIASSDRPSALPGSCRTRSPSGPSCATCRWLVGSPISPRACWHDPSPFRHVPCA